MMCRYGNDRVPNALSQRCNNGYGHTRPRVRFDSM
jgi:hypothetical protein